MSDRSLLLTVAISPHAIRSCWVTQMTSAGLDFATLTRIFGDSASVTWEGYLKADKFRPISQWTRELAKAIGDRTDHPDGLVNPADSSPKKPRWPAMYAQGSRGSRGSDSCNHGLRLRRSNP
jgi:hypothetical protein